MPEIALRQYESEIDHLIEEARYLEALAHTRHILRQHPRYIGAYYLLGKTLLEANQPELAIDMFQRALYADPEHLMARIGLTLAHQRVDNLDAAIWNLERAVELNPGDTDLIDELRQLYGRRDGFEPERVPLNRAGLARLYMRGHRPGRAVEELRALLAENPQRLDLRLALAEAYWRDDQIVQAADACQVLLDDARYCLKANLLLGALWIDSGQEEGQTYLDRAQEIDLENTLANELFGAASPLKPREVSIEHLTYRPDALDVDQQAKWFQKLEAASVSVSLAPMQPEMTSAEARLVDITAGLEAQIEIPDWLRELGDEEDGALSWMADIGAEVEAAEPLAEVEAPVPDWLRSEEVAEIVAEEELPDWLRTAEPEEIAAKVELEGLGFEDEIGVSEDVPGTGIPDWLSELEPAAQVEEGAPGLGDAPDLGGAPGTGVPDWLQALQPTAPAAEEIPLPAEGLPDWLSELKRPGEAAEAVEGEPSLEGASSEEALDWLASLQPAAPAAEEVTEVEEEELPEWMEDFEGVGKTSEEVLATEEGALPDWLTAFQPEETAATAAAVPTEETALEADIPDWLSELQPAEVEVEGVPLAEELAPGAGAPGAGEPETGIPDWLSEFQPAAELEAEAEAVEEDLLEWLGEIPVEEAAVTAEAALPEALTFGEEIGEEPAEEPAEELALTREETPVAEGFFGWEAFSEEITEVETGPLEAAHFIEEVAEEEISAPVPVAESEQLPGDDALAWLESLAAGKEEDLRAQAEAEAAPAEIAESELDWESLAEQLEDVQGEIAVAPLPEGDDALAWLESLAVGEMIEEFVTEAETMAPESLIEAPVEELAEAPATEGFFGWEAFGEEITEVTAPDAEGDFMTGDDALAWLESLTTGKEEELRAQAEAEAQVRVAEILGHKAEAKPVEPEPVVEEPVVIAEAVPPTEGFFGWEAFGEEIAEVEAAAPATEEIVPGEVESIAESVVDSIADSDFLSGDDAIAWLSSLAEGKEDELRAQAEVETQARVAEILGRRPEPKVAQPPAEVTPEPAIEKPVEPESAAAELPVAEGDVMSGDDALAWLSSIAAGKEDELRAQAEVEAQTRVAEILGRKVEPSKPQVVGPEPIVEETHVKEAGPTAEGDLLPGTAALSWLESFAEGREEELRAQAEAEAEVRVAEILGRKPESTVAEAPKVEPEVTPKVLLTEAEPGEEAEYTGLLAQARAAWQAGDIETALAHYTELIQAEAGLDDVIADLQQAATAQPNNGTLLQLLGDAYMANGMIDKAIEIFNQAMGLI